MSRYSQQFNQRESDITWMFCFICGALILCATLYNFIVIIQHLHCIPETSAAEITPKRNINHVKTYSTLSTCFATLCVITTFNMYSLCLQFQCWFTVLGITNSILFWNSFILSKTFLYLLFVGRLFNRNYRRIYQYSKHIQYFLWTLLVILLIIMVIFDVGLVLEFKGIKEADSIVNIWYAVYGITECTLATVTTVLFFRPLCTPRIRRNSLKNMSVVMKFGIISGVQFIAALCYGMSFLGRIYLQSNPTDPSVWSSYLDICRILQMLDCYLLMICIYIGFARQQHTVCPRGM